MEKYYLSLKHLREFYPDKVLNGLTRDDVQKFLNWFGKTHEKATVQDLYRQIGACLKDAHYEGYMRKDPTYRLAIKGKKPTPNLKIYEDIHCFEVPDGAVYLTRTGWFVKGGLDSYEGEDCRYDSQECETYLAKVGIQQPRRNAKVGGNLR